MSGNSPVTRSVAAGDAASDGEVRPALALVGLSKSFGAGRVLDELHLRVAAGEVYGLVAALGLAGIFVRAGFAVRPPGPGLG
jgi:hypothetical protein